MSASYGFPGIVIAVVSGLILYLKIGIDNLLTFFLLWGLLSAALATTYSIVVDTRKYRKIGNEVEVKEGLFGKWKNLEEHIKKDHPELKE